MAPPLDVLFVSKPIAPPFHDGAKCLVRDIATHLESSRPTVMTMAGAPPLARVVMEPVYPGSGGFAPSVRDNVRVLARLLLGARADIWHFVFAPNPRSSGAARFALRARRTKTVQTVASVPRSFEGVSRLLFGDRVVALSSWTRDRLVEGGADGGRIRVIPPGVPRLVSPAPAAIAEVRRSLELADEDEILLYPGDIEHSSGAPLLAAAVPRILAHRRQAVVVFACRKKTLRAEAAEERIKRALSSDFARVRFPGEVADLTPLLACSTAVLFPVDDLYGKIDLPMALLEAMALGVPVIALDHGPLRELGGGPLVPPGDAAALARATVSLLENRAHRDELGQQAREIALTRYRPEAAAAAYEEVYRDLCP